MAGAAENRSDRAASQRRQQVERAFRQRQLARIAPQHELAHVGNTVPARRKRQDVAVTIDVCGGQTGVGGDETSRGDEDQRKHRLSVTAETEIWAGCQEISRLSYLSPWTKLP